MTKAAIHAMHLRELLRAGLAPARFAERMRLDLPALVERHAWMTTVYGDLVFPQAVRPLENLGSRLKLSPKQWDGRPHPQRHRCAKVEVSSTT